MKQKIVISSGLPYSNGEIHLGHIASTYLPADIFARYSRLSGKEVVFVCGTDDYGTPILIKAEQEDKSPEEFVKTWWKRDKEDFTNLGISFDIFHKTHSPENIELVQHFFKALNENGYIFTQEVENFFCENDKKFLPDRYLRGVCPFCKSEDQYGDSCEKCGKTYSPQEVVDPKCAICGNKPKLKRTSHYFFKLSQFSDQLEEWLKTNQNLQKKVTNYVLQWIKEGLRDWDITRDITWGVPIPLKEAKGKVLYGWFDNHLGYVSFALKYLNDKGLNSKSFWNSSKIYHFIGKDIVYHHYLFMTAMRMGEGSYKIPDYIPVRGHLLLQSRKFSKSRGWYISLKDFLDKFPADHLRYYLASVTTYSQDDINFDWKEFQARINNELVANIGNFVHRALTFIWNKSGGKVPNPLNLDEYDKEMENKIKSIAKDVGKEVENNEVGNALKKILAFSTFCNKYFQKKEPWKNNPESCLYYCANAVRALAILLSPFVPFASEKLWTMTNLEGDIYRQEWKSASKLNVPVDHKIKEPKIIFEKVEDEAVENELGKLR